MAKKPATKRNPVLCGAKKGKSNVPCTQPAGKGTDHLGKGRCYWHEGKPGVTAVSREQQKELGLMVPIETTPTQAILGLLAIAAGEMAYVETKVGELDEDDIWIEGSEGGEYLNKWIRWRDRVMGKVAKIAQAASAMGVSERQVALAEEQTRMMGRLIEAVATRLELTPKQRARLGPAIREELQQMNERAAEVVG